MIFKENIVILFFLREILHITFILLFLKKILHMVISCTHAFAQMPTRTDTTLDQSQKAGAKSEAHTDTTLDQSQKAEATRKANTHKYAQSHMYNILYMFFFCIYMYV
jgi:hypothetical protein